MRRLLALLVAAAHALALKTQGVGGGRLALLDFSGAMRGAGGMQLKRDRVRAHVWGRVTARFNAIAENCAGVWKL